MLSRSVLLLVLLGVASALHAVGPGDAAPDVAIQQGWNDAQGKSQLAQYAGRVVLVETWATW